MCELLRVLRVWRSPNQPDSVLVVSSTRTLRRGDRDFRSRLGSDGGPSPPGKPPSVLGHEENFTKKSFFSSKSVRWGCHGAKTSVFTKARNFRALGPTAVKFSGIVGLVVVFVWFEGQGAQVCGLSARGRRKLFRGSRGRCSRGSPMASKSLEKGFSRT